MAAALQLLYIIRATGGPLQMRRGVDLRRFSETHVARRPAMPNNRMDVKFKQSVSITFFPH